jgi:EAL domain-containing protein (putative c-di-GMP-specific phosphodiesterase class I)
LSVDLVRAVAARLAAACPNVEIARLSTNMLGAVWFARGAEDSHQTIMMLHHAMARPITLGGTPIDVDVTIGSCEAAASDSAHESGIVDRAIMAIGQAREKRQSVARFDGDLCGDPRASLSLMSDMLLALDRDTMGLHYQPKQDLRNGAIVGVEALVRWRHPQRGPLAPDAFLPMAEETGRVAALTEWVLKRSIADQRRLADLGHRLSFAVNLSGRLLDDPDFASTILAIVGDAVGDIILEVTETAIIGNPQVARETLEAFRAAGISISIDDYGSGLSSLGYLKSIPADELKIDRMFVVDLAEDRTDELLVRSAIDLAHSLGLQVVAEGVETEPALKLLAAMGCDLAQGYLLARPMPFHELEALLRQHAIAATQRPLRRAAV